MSKTLNNKNPANVVSQIWPVENVCVLKKTAAKKVIAWPANSSATTCPGSALPVWAITAGANITQTTHPNKARIAKTIDCADGPSRQTKAKTTAGGSEPHVPGASGR